MWIVHDHKYALVYTIHNICQILIWIYRIPKPLHRNNNTHFYAKGSHWRHNNQAPQPLLFTRMLLQCGAQPRLSLPTHITTHSCRHCFLPPEALTGKITIKRNHFLWHAYCGCDCCVFIQLLTYEKHNRLFGVSTLAFILVRITYE